MTSMENVLGSLLNPVYAAAVGVLAGYFLKWLTERTTREYEREAKRLQFFKAFYDLHLSDKPAVTPEFDQRCQQLLRDTSRWMEFRPTKAVSLAKQLAFCVSLVCWYFIMVYVWLKLPRVTPPLEPMRLGIGVCIGIIAAVVVYFPLFPLLVFLLSKRAGLREVKW